MTINLFKSVKVLLAAVAATGALTSNAPKAEAQELFIGEIRFFSGNFAPRNWALCNGQLLSISQWSALFSIVGTTYGGDGRRTFALPDMRGRVPIHPGTGPGLSPVALGEKGGQETVTLSVAQIPAHTHSAALASNALNLDVTLQASDQPGTVASPTGGTLADDGTDRIYNDLAPNVAMNPGHITASGSLA
ncbi:MAG: tail fiber protein, partial [Pseudomonadota bacterium]